MKSLKLMFFACAIGTFAHAAPKTEAQATCEALASQAYDQCVQEICEEDKVETGAEECVMDAGFREMASECAYETFPSLLEAHNKKNGTKLVCE